MPLLTTYVVALISSVAGAVRYASATGRAGETRNWRFTPEER